MYYISEEFSQRVSLGCIVEPQQCQCVAHMALIFMQIVGGEEGRSLLLNMETPTIITLDLGNNFFIVLQSRLVKMPELRVYAAGDRQ